MLQYRTPGVYFEWLDKRGPAIVPLRTDIAGFVGIASSGPLHVPVKIESFTQFTSTFGGHTPQAYLAYAVEGFFANGGQTCWVVRVADDATARAAFFDLKDENNQPILRLSAISRVTKRDERGRPSFEVYPSPGTSGENITFTLSSTARDRFSLIIRLGSAQEIWRDLSLDPDDPRNVEKLINGTANNDSNKVNGPNKASGSNLVQAKVLASSSRRPFNTPDRLATGLRGGVGRLQNGKDGLKKLNVDHFTGVNIFGSTVERQGLAALELIDEVSIVAIPDIMPKPVVTLHPPKTPPHDCGKLDRADFEDLYKDVDEPWPTLECCLPVIEPEPPLRNEEPLELAPRFNGDQVLFLQTALIAHCEKLKDRIAVLDMPLLNPGSGVELTPELAQTWRTNFDTKYGAIYFPWLRVPDALKLEGLLRSVPPSGHVAGIYARGDRRVGVHKPPANEELEGVKDVQVFLEDVDHGALNDRGVNVIRPYLGRGVRVAGARTLSSSPEWRFVNVRRLLIMIEEAIDEQTQWTVFEPNNRDLWSDIERVARAFLDTIWHRGMLDGATPEEAFSVCCDETTNPQSETDVGRVICEIGVLPPWPAEFVVVRIGKTEGGTEIIEEAN
jgi:phage tail sheath protein FI